MSENEAPPAESELMKAGKHEIDNALDVVEKLVAKYFTFAPARIAATELIDKVREKAGVPDNYAGDAD